MRSRITEPFKFSLRAKMAAQVDLLRAKVEKEKMRDSLDRLIREKKKKKKRDMSPSADKREKYAKEEKQVKLHHHHLLHHHHGEHRTYQLQQNPKPRKFSADKHVPQSRHHQRHPCHIRGLTNGTKKLQPTVPPPPPPPALVPELLQKKKKRKQTVLPEPPALFTFTPLRAAKAEQRDEDLTRKLKKENTEANVKCIQLKNKKGELFRLMHLNMCMGTYEYAVLKTETLTSIDIYIYIYYIIDRCQCFRLCVCVCVFALLSVAIFIMPPKSHSFVFSGRL